MRERQLLAEARRDGIQKLVVGAIVHHRGRALILRRSASDPSFPGIEELPSGSVEEGETLLAALEREMVEEIGWNGPLVNPSYVASFDYISGSGRRTRQLTFAVAHQGAPIRLSSEHTGYRWLSLTDLATSDVTPETAQTILSWASTAGITRADYWTSSPS